MQKIDGEPVLDLPSRAEFDPLDCPWPGRPNCEPVGTTVGDTLPNDPLCGERRFYDEVGEAGYREGWCY